METAKVKISIGGGYGCFLLSAAVVVSAFAARAEALLWYRFDGDGATVVNKANPGVMDGTFKSINSWGSLGGLGNTAAKFPARGAAFPSGAKLRDGASGTVYADAVQGLTFTGDPSNSGTVCLYKDEMTEAFANLSTFTCEVFFRLPADTAAVETRRAKDILFPLADWRSPDGGGYGWFLGLRKDSASGNFYPFCRCKWNNGSSTPQSKDFQNTAAAVTVGQWHHLAFRLTRDASANTAAGQLILDYVPLTGPASASISGFYGFDHNYGGAFPFLVGADVWRKANNAQNCCFIGEIAEVRVSDAALDVDALLRPVPPGPVDDDTFVCLTADDADWFGTAPSASVAAPYYGILNAAAGSSVVQPFWLLRGSATPAYPALSDVATDGGVRAAGTVRAAYRASDAVADTKALTVSRALDNITLDGVAQDQYCGHVVRIPYEGQGLTEGDFTLEWFFKTDGAVPSGNTINSYTFTYSSFAKIMINQANGSLLTRLIAADGSYTDRPYSGKAVDDAAWHHYALVYDSRYKRCLVYLDYEPIDSTVASLRTTTAVPFCFGGESRNGQVFSGQLDDLRITRRALAAHEFLTTRPVVSAATALDAKFEGDLSSGQDALLAPAGIGKARTDAGAAPTFVSVNRKIDLDGDGVADRTSTQALRIRNGVVVFPWNALAECRDFTVEFFARLNAADNNAMLLRASAGKTETSSVAWALYRVGTGTLRLAVVTSPDGTWNATARKDLDPKTGGLDDMFDGKWHHWAVTAQTDATVPSTTFTVYRDYEVYGNPCVFSGDGTTGGMLAIPYGGTSFSFGGSGALDGVYDDLRVTPSVLSPAAFMHAIPSGTLFILR